MIIWGYTRKAEIRKFGLRLMKSYKHLFLKKRGYS